MHITSNSWNPDALSIHLVHRANYVYARVIYCNHAHTEPTLDIFERVIRDVVQHAITRNVALVIRIPNRPGGNGVAVLCAVLDRARYEKLIFELDDETVPRLFHLPAVFHTAVCVVWCCPGIPCFWHERLAPGRVITFGARNVETELYHAAHSGVPVEASFRKYPPDVYADIIQEWERQGMCALFSGSPILRKAGHGGVDQRVYSILFQE